MGELNQLIYKLVTITSMDTLVCHVKDGPYPDVAK